MGVLTLDVLTYNAKYNSFMLMKVDLPNLITKILSITHHALIFFKVGCSLCIFPHKHLGSDVDYRFYTFPYLSCFHEIVLNDKGVSTYG